MNKVLSIIENPEDRKMFQKIAEFLDKTYTGMTQIQIENFVLNDVEFPTDYGKFVQAQRELSLRFSLVVDYYYQIKEKEVKIKMKKREMKKEKDELKKELIKIQIEKLEFQLFSLKKELKKICQEARFFYAIYEKHPEFHNLKPEEAFKLEALDWAKKTMNMPTIFEERYGENYMIKALGEENYKKYKELRQKSFGFLPREIFEVKQLKDGKEKFNEKQLGEGNNTNKS
jgi:uncharacterized protein YeaC (DUF1315 family)